jgi:hypothetical protein
VWVSGARSVGVWSPSGSPSECGCLEPSECGCLEPLTFLGNPVRLDHCVRVIRKVKLIISKSDIKRRLKQPANAVKVRFATTPKTEFTVKLADP